MFRLIQECSGTEWSEMYKVFNCGHRLEFYCSPAEAAKIIAISEGFNIPAQIVGKVEAKAGKPEVIVRSDHGEFVY